MKNFLINLSVVTALAGAASWFAVQQFPQLDVSIATYVCIYFFVATALSYYIITQASEKSGEKAVRASNKFVSRYMLVTVSKFFLSIFILVGFVLFFPILAVHFIILFATCYFLFTVFEVVSLMQFFRGKKQPLSK